MPSRITTFRSIKCLLHESHLPLIEGFESVFPNARSEECYNLTCHICTRFDTSLQSRMLCRMIKSFLPYFCRHMCSPKADLHM